MPDSSLVSELVHLARTKIRGRADTRRAAALILRYAESSEAYDLPSRPFGRPFFYAFAALQSVADEQAANELRREALPAMRALFDRRYERREREPPPNGYDPDTGDLLFALKVLTMYGGAENYERLVRAVRAGFAPDDFMWSPIFAALAQRGDDGAAVLEAASRPLPTGFVAVAILDAANGLALRRTLRSHPFDCVEGYERCARI